MLNVTKHYNLMLVFCSLSQQVLVGRANAENAVRTSDVASVSSSIVKIEGKL